MAGVAGLWFTFFRPERLHTEEHIHQMRQLDIVETKGGDFAINRVDLVEYTSPRQLPKAEGEGNARG